MVQQTEQRSVKHHRPLEDTVKTTHFRDLKERDQLSIYKNREERRSHAQPLVTLEIMEIIGEHKRRGLIYITQQYGYDDRVMSEGSTYRLTDYVWLQISGRKHHGRRLHVALKMPNSYEYQHDKNRINPSR